MFSKSTPLTETNSRIGSLLRVLLATSAIATLLTACHSSYVNAQNELEVLLNSEAGQRMTADELAEIIPDFADRLRGAGCEVHLPLTGEQTIPVGNQPYVSPSTGSRMIFHLTIIDSLNTIGTVDMVLHEDHWGLPADSLVETIQYIVQSRGKSVYTLYNSIESRWEGRLLYVYPGADSIQVTRGSRETQQIFYLTVSGEDSLGQ